MNIYESINRVMADIGAIGKDSKNQTQGFAYRGIDAVMNSLNPALVKNKVFAVPEVLEQTREERQNTKGTNLIYSICKVRYHFFAEDGSSVSATVIGEGMDTGDKATNKAMSIAFKYACFQVFCIPTEEMIDPDRESHEVKQKPEPKKEAPKKAEESTVQQSMAAVISPEQKAQILKQLNRTKVALNDVLTRYKVKDLADLPEMYYQGLLKNLLALEDR